ncbi:MAG: glycosyltransferase [Planctomycetaceae bacterium]|nr:glycosyltransferase [Planctomycetaceae bacterium]
MSAPLIRIAYVIPTLDQSGAERQLTLLATSLPHENYLVRVIALQRGGPYLKVLTAAGIDVRIIGKRFRFDPLTWYRLRQELKSFQPDIVQSFLFAANSYVRLPGITPSATKIVVSERCVDSWKSKWQLSLDRHQVATTDAMTANSVSVADFYAGVGVPRDLITVIPNALPLTPPRYSKQQARAILGLSDEHRVVGFAGRLAPQKRLHDVVWAFQLLHQLVDNARLVIIGSGPERDLLAELASSFGCRDKIIFTGHREDAFDLMTAFDVFVLGSEFEGMSNSLMEAMSLGLPCIVSDIAPNRELIIDHETGLLFPTGRSPALAKQATKILSDPALAQQLGQAARHRIVTQHTVAQMVGKHDALYRRLMASTH